MNRLSMQELALISGGSSETNEFSGMTCAALQNHAGLFGKNWDDAKWDKWIDAMIAAGCPHVIVTPSEPNPTTPDN